jgi:hypothetical protein
MLRNKLGATSLIAVVVVVGLAPASAAATETVETPAGTYHVHHETTVNDRSYNERVCVPLGPCFAFSYPFVDPSLAVFVYEETNGCEGLQTQSSDCDDDGDEESADRELVAMRKGV